MKKLIVPIIILMTLSACSQLGLSSAEPAEPVDMSGIESQLDALDKKIEEHNKKLDVIEAKLDKPVETKELKNPNTKPTQDKKPISGEYSKPVPPKPLGKLGEDKNNPYKGKIFVEIIDDPLTDGLIFKGENKTPYIEAGTEVEYTYTGAYPWIDIVSNLSESMQMLEPFKGLNCKVEIETDKSCALVVTQYFVQDYHSLWDGRLDKTPTQQDWIELLAFHAEKIGDVGTGYSGEVYPNSNVSSFGDLEAGFYPQVTIKK